MRGLVKNFIFTVVVRTEFGSTKYAAIGPNSAAVHAQAIDRFGACGVTVTPNARIAS